MKNFLTQLKNKGFTKVKRGFTLIETLVAITILLIAIVGPMQIASQSLFASFYARDQITAYYLAQEGIEYIRHDRDNFFLSNPKSTTWPAEFGTDCVANTNNAGCKIDVQQPDTGISACGEPSTSSSSPSCGYLDFDSDTGLYSYNSGDKSKFYRIITIDPFVPSTDDSITIHSTVNWNTTYFYSNKANTFTLTETLYRWQTK